ncbi:MAG: hypothetical protein ACRYGP_13920 [Janthinobacterium lividum]
MDEATQPASESGAAPARALIPLVLPSAAWAASAAVVRSVPFQYPVTFAGREWPGIGIRRLSVEQIAAVFENYRLNREIDPEYAFSLPIYVDKAGEPIPAGLLGKIDPDDADTVDEVAESFLPRRYRVAKDLGPSTSPNGEATAPSSSA